MAVLVGKPVPNFKAQAVLPGNEIQTIHSQEYLKNKYGIIFFYPLNFTFVCPSEILAFNDAIPEFKKKEAEVIGISVDSPYSHIAYKAMAVNEGGIGNVAFPLISDLGGKIAESFDVLSEESVAFRATFLVDKQGIIRHQVVNDLPLGRSISETIRMLDALQHTEMHGEVCPANWSHGKEAMKPTQEGVVAYLKKHPNIS
ncbi:peroxiredoxin [Rickettsiales endosymbiont of Peranema trichophorum]|uniref:peroxiredoxin n=1 Tax=Rickettsiales endosymbiont of Peranema trichophorum TaxID=2486577 RepID=UPI0010237FA9|nr:peroxiredoxin [Rickettsiales endosymbiont of Peranema trichophorum]RZI47338.1 peroxiredoxin [Rickettsiales endosymbiont of Peranema trichophorum]